MVEQWRAGDVGREREQVLEQRGGAVAEVERDRPAARSAGVGCDARGRAIAAKVKLPYERRAVAEVELVRVPVRVGEAQRTAAARAG